MRNPLLLTDFYKVIHHNCYKPGLEYLYSYWTPRMSRLEGVNKVVMFGLQSFIQKYLVDGFNEGFFNRPLKEVIDEYKRIIKFTMGDRYTDTTHIEKLHKLGYLPIRINAIPEGSRANIKTPMIEIKNTHKEFAWLVNYIETLMSCNIWQLMTSATIAFKYREIVDKYYKETTMMDWELRRNACGDFSLRGMSSVETGSTSGAAHLLMFNSTACIPGILHLEKYYNTNIEDSLVGKGTASTEHSIMCTYGHEEFIGYTTKWGDNVCDFNPIANYTTEELMLIGEHIGLPRELVYKEPSDGLCEKTDEENLGFSYESLNKYIIDGTCGDKHIDRIILNLNKISKHKREDIPRFKPIYHAEREMRNHI